MKLALLVEYSGLFAVCFAVLACDVRAALRRRHFRRIEARLNWNR